MPILSEVSFGGLPEDLRLDAEFYDPRYGEAMAALATSKPLRIVQLGSLLSTLTNGHTPLHHDLTTGEVPFLTAEHVFDFRVNFDSDKRIRRSHHDGELKRTQLRPGDFLFTIKGRVGNVAVAEDIPGPTNINQDVALFRLGDAVPPYYLLAYLNSRVGKAFSQRYSTGQINPFLGLTNLRLVPIPLYSSNRMQSVAERTRDLVATARDARKQSERLLADAAGVFRDLAKVSW